MRLYINKPEIQTDPKKEKSYIDISMKSFLKILILAMVCWNAIVIGLMILVSIIVMVVW